EVMTRIYQKSNGVYFLDGPAGSGKTYLYNWLLAHVRASRLIALAIASSGISALLLK
ncbi:12505_t:CDS:1, partial [Cetraspora pellucida]